MKAIQALIGGFVQGVGFRAWVRRAAMALGARGWVRNLDDGRVEVWIEGDPEAVDGLVRALAEGPPAARVERVDTRSVEPSGASDFVQRANAAAPEA